ncbi:MAG: mechanosensitive ion channel family protein [Longimicrobiales bacterium]
MTRLRPLPVLQEAARAAADTADRLGVEGILGGIQNTISAYTGIAGPTQEKIFKSLVIIAVLWLLRAVVIHFTRVEDLRVRYRWRKVASYVAALLGLLLVGRVWFEGVHSIMTYLGLISAGIAIALRDPIVNMAGWAFLMWRRPFVVGDRIEIASRAGDVIDMRLFQFTLLEIGEWVGSDQSTGRIVHVPNGKVFQDPVMNYTRGFQYIWNELSVPLTFDSDWKKAKELLREIAKHNAEQLSEDAERRVLQASRRFMIFYSTLTPTVYTSLVPNGILLTVRYLTEPRRRRGSEEKIWEEILDAFAGHEDIVFAYPAQRLYVQPWEGRAAREVPVVPPDGPRFREGLDG